MCYGFDVTAFRSVFLYTNKIQMGLHNLKAYMHFMHGGICYQSSINIVLLYNILLTFSCNCM